MATLGVHSEVAAKLAGHLIGANAILDMPQSEQSSILVDADAGQL